MDPTQLQPGYRLDRYELLCPLAYGGMATVWLARFGGSLGFERTVVIKMILPQFSQDPRFQEMFLDEARIASRIEHPNVARILDVGEQEESYFIVMEWVDGDSLSKVLRAAHSAKERVPWGIALRICADAAAGLHAAHQLRGPDGAPLGVVHRDVSPQNLLVANTGATVVIDFGVAKARDRVSQDTSAGQLKGKIRYMAPEQALGKEIDSRADVWAIGAMLYEMLSGTPPFDGPNEVATLHLLTSGQRPKPLGPSYPAPIRAIVERALAHAPEDRFESALAMGLALEDAMTAIAEPTTAANVALYTGRLLAERKASRRKAVDRAIAAANERTSLAPLSRPALSIPPSDRHPSYASRSSLVGPPEPKRSDPSGLAESPSAASNGTFGSAALDFVPPQPMHAPRYLVPIVIGVSAAAAVLGLVIALKGPWARRAAPATPPPPATVEYITATTSSAPPLTLASSAPTVEPPPDPSTRPATTIRRPGFPVAPPKLPKPPAHPDRGF